MPAGESKCTQCRDNGQECIVRHDDDRRKPSSKAYVQSLNERILHLEALLEVKDKEHSVSAPSPPKTAARTPLQSGSEGSVAMQQLPRIDQDTVPEHHSPAPVQTVEHPSPARSSVSTTSAGGSMVYKVLSAKRHLDFDRLSGRIRYYGPTTNIHVFSELATEHEEYSRQSMEQQRRVSRLLSTVSQQTQDYLLEMFWQYYNSVIHVVHRASFEEGMRTGQSQNYSPFLHVCVLAMGFRHADKRRRDIKRITFHGRESILHREAKFMLDYELERPGGVATVQALLLLSDLECGVGRDNMGWLISGTAIRLCFDVGLHLDTSSFGLSQVEAEIRRMTFWACVIYDRYWALFLGRPTAMKPEDLEIYRLADQFGRLGTLEPAGPSMSLEKQIYEALLDLMELAGEINKVVDDASKPGTRLDQQVYFHMAALDRRLQSWYSRLHSPLRWSTDANNTTHPPPCSYFLLHQQYHAALILLHRQFAQYDNIVSGTPGDEAEENQKTHLNGHLAALSRDVCTASAGKIAQIFWQSKQYYASSKIFITGLQHAGTAALALVAAIASSKDTVTYDTNRKYLEVLAAAIEDMCETYQPAERMSTVLKEVLNELIAMQPLGFPAAKPSLRRDSEGDSHTSGQAKRHQVQSSGRRGLDSSLAIHQAQAQAHRQQNQTGSKRVYQENNDLLLVQDTDWQGRATEGFRPQHGDAPVGQQDADLRNCWSGNHGASPFVESYSPLPAEFQPCGFLAQSSSTWMGAETSSFSPFAADVGSLDPNQMLQRNDQAAHTDSTTIPLGTLCFMTLLPNSTGTDSSRTDIDNNLSSRHSTHDAAIGPSSVGTGWSSSLPPGATRSQPTDLPNQMRPPNLSRTSFTGPASEDFGIQNPGEGLGNGFRK